MGRSRITSYNVCYTKLLRYVKWRIEDFAKFYLATGGGSRLQAEDLLKRKISNGLRSEIGSRTIKDIVSGERTEVMEDALKLV